MTDTQTMMVIMLENQEGVGHICMVGGGGEQGMTWAEGGNVGCCFMCGGQHCTTNLT